MRLNECDELLAEPVVVTVPETPVRLRTLLNVDGQFESGVAGVYLKNRDPGEVTIYWTHKAGAVAPDTADMDPILANDAMRFRMARSTLNDIWVGTGTGNGTAKAFVSQS
jgi:hypothetical protein